jgi:hypothetical protein
MKGFSRSNLFYIHKFYQFYSTTSVEQLVGLNKMLPDTHSVQQPVAPEIETSVQQSVGFISDLLIFPWGHHVVLLDKAGNTDQALFYIRQTIENNWIRSILTLQLEHDFFSRQVKAITIFK